MVDKSFGPVIKARNADRVVFTLARFDEFPDLWVSDTTLPRHEEGHRTPTRSRASTSGARPS